jgi:AraC-like DNA-binding protein
MAKKKQGFAGERQIILTKSILKSYLEYQTSFNNAYFLEAGFFPNAKYQYLENFNGEGNFQIVYCINGYGSANVNYKNYHLSVGDFLIVPSNTSFSYQADELKPWSFYSIKFNGVLYQEIIEQYLKLNGSIKNYFPYTEERIKLLNQLYNCLNQGVSFGNISMINTLLIHFISALSILNDQNETQKTDNNKKIIHSSIKYLRENYSKNINLKNMSDQASLSISHFSKIFKIETGVSPVNYLINLKVKKACEFLQFTNLLIKEVSFKVGIQDIHYFTKVFTKNIGLSPNQYRKSKI